MRIECYDPRNKKNKCFAWSGQGCTLLTEGFKKELCPFYKSRQKYRLDKEAAADRLKERDFLGEAIAMYGRSMVMGNERVNKHSTKA